jgi:hypothetical protein
MLSTLLTLGAEKMAENAGNPSVYASFLMVYKTNSLHKGKRGTHPIHNKLTVHPCFEHSLMKSSINGLIHLFL